MIYIREKKKHLLQFFANPAKIYPAWKKCHRDNFQTLARRRKKQEIGFLIVFLVMDRLYGYEFSSKASQSKIDRLLFVIWTEAMKIIGLINGLILLASHLKRREVRNDTYFTLTDLTRLGHLIIFTWKFWSILFDKL